MPDGELEKELEALRSDLANLRADIARIAETVKQGTAETVRQRYEHLERSLREQIQELLDAARTRSRHSVEEVEHQIEEKPFVSLLVAFGIGLLLSQLIGRR
jgi:ElaB/YqjD/DUF883 family membrane-anchored ribosome-binding protein